MRNNDANERQLTFAPRHHQLTNSNIWTPDSAWVVYDVRPDTASFLGETIERVNLQGECELLYRATASAHVGVVTVAPRLPLRYVFIHGPEHPTAEWHYSFHCRRGVMVSADNGDKAVTLDALSITPPFMAGALRGGSHVHMFSADGSRLSFTYNDAVMHHYDSAKGRRNVAIALPFGPVVPSLHHPREYAGSHYCVVISRTIENPPWGSDHISRAYEEGWIGDRGYRKADGTWQRWAIAFIGDTRSHTGERLPEIFVVDLPEAVHAYQQSGDEPLEGTATTLPAPPKGVEQRRITFTTDQRFPGVVNQPRHWLRSSPDGEHIAFLMRDERGVTQLWTVSPNGGAPLQRTMEGDGVQSALSWHPNGEAIAFVMDNSIMCYHLPSDQLQRLTPRTEQPPEPDAVVFSPDGSKIAYLRNIAGFKQVFLVEFT